MESDRDGIEAGFKAGRSMVGDMYTAMQVIEKKTAINQEVLLIQVDLKKAYVYTIKHNLGNP